MARYEVRVSPVGYWKSFSSKANAQKEASRLRKDGGKNVRVVKAE